MIMEQHELTNNLVLRVLLVVAWVRVIFTLHFKLPDGGFILAFSAFLVACIVTTCIRISMKVFYYYYENESSWNKLGYDMMKMKAVKWFKIMLRKNVHINVNKELWKSKTKYE